MKSVFVDSLEHYSRNYTTALKILYLISNKTVQTGSQQLVLLSSYGYFSTGMRYGRAYVELDAGKKHL